MDDRGTLGKLKRAISCFQDPDGIHQLIRLPLAAVVVGAAGQVRVDGQEGSSNDVAGVDESGDGPARTGERPLVEDRIFRGCEIPAIVAGDVPTVSGEPGPQPVGQPGPVVLIAC